MFEREIQVLKFGFNLKNRLVEINRGVSSDEFSAFEDDYSKFDECFSNLNELVEVLEHIVDTDDDENFNIREVEDEFNQARSLSDEAYYLNKDLISLLELIENKYLDINIK